MENVLLEEINRMRKLMNLTEKENLEEDDSLTNNPDNDWIVQSLRKQLGGDKEIFVKLVDKRPGKEGKTNLVKIVNGKVIDVLDDEPEEVNEGIKDTLKIGAICAILATGAVSCTKEDSYNLTNDARYIMKPEILNTLGRESFDSPVGSKEKIYVWAGNQSGGRGSNSRYLYHDYTNKNKNYGAVFGQNYPDSFANGANGITPTEVVGKTKLTSDIAKRLQKYSKIDLSKYTDTSTTLGKSGTNNENSNLYVIVVDVLGSSHYDWSDPNGAKEIKDPKWKTGYAIYIVSPSVAEGMTVGELYPTTLDVMFGTYSDPLSGNKKIRPLDDYFNNNFKNLLGDKPEF
jgi:hypothetical protein